MYHLIITSCIFFKASADVTSSTDRIVEDIMKNYKKDTRPTGKVSDRGVELGIKVVPLHFQINSEFGTLNSHIWYVMNWKDERLKWAPTNYENVSTVHLSPDTIWHPDIMVYNSVEHFEYEQVDMMIQFDGQIWWVPPTTLHTSCTLDLTYWPWDRQVCHLTVGSWTKTGWELDIQNLDGSNITSVDRANFAPGNWDLIEGKQ